MLQVKEVLHSTKHVGTYPIPQHFLFQNPLAKHSNDMLQDCRSGSIHKHYSCFLNGCKFQAVPTTVPVNIPWQCTRQYIVVSGTGSSFSCYRNSAEAYGYKEEIRVTMCFLRVYWYAHFQNPVWSLHTRPTWPCWHNGHRPTMGRSSTPWSLYHLL